MKLNPFLKKSFYYQNNVNYEKRINTLDKSLIITFISKSCKLVSLSLQFQIISSSIFLYYLFSLLISLFNSPTMNIKLTILVIILWIANVLADTHQIRSKISPFRDIRGFRQPSISTARGFGKRFSGSSTDSLSSGYL